LFMTTSAVLSPLTIQSLIAIIGHKTTILYCSTFYVHFDGSWPKLKSLPPTLYG
jgi:hypothetical protein